MTLILIVIVAVYVAELFWLRTGLRRSDSTPSDPGYLPVVSVIVAARNEELLIGSCMQSLISLDYPKDRLEIIIVDDGSDDRTNEIARSVAGTAPGVIVMKASTGNGNLRGKTNAVACGIARSRGEILLFTDADCVVHPGWVRATVRHFGPETGVVGGFTLLETHRLLDRVQALDWLFLFSIASGTAGWKIPLTVIGNNMAVRRETYLQTGGYEAIPFSVTEDYALVRAILNRTRSTVRFPIDGEATVTSRPCESVKRLYQQKKRWGVGGLDMILPGMIIMAIGWWARLMLVISIGTAGILPWFCSLGALMLAETALLYPSLRRFKRLPLLRSVLVFELYISLYVLVIPFLACFSRRVVWKERRHDSRQGSPG